MNNECRFKISRSFTYIIFKFKILRSYLQITCAKQLKLELNYEIIYKAVEAEITLKNILFFYQRNLTSSYIYHFFIYGMIRTGEYIICTVFENSWG